MSDLLKNHIVGFLMMWLICCFLSLDWFPKEPNNGHMEYLFFLLAGLTIINLGVFIIVARLYKYRVPDFEAKEDDGKIDLPDQNHVYDNNKYESEKPPLEKMENNMEHDQTRM